MYRLDHEPGRPLGPRSRFKALLRWLNLTLLQHATFPAVLLLTGWDYRPIGDMELRDLLLRLIGPVAVATAAALEIRRRLALSDHPAPSPSPEAPPAATPISPHLTASTPSPPPGRRPVSAWPAPSAPGALASQARLLIPGVALMLAVVRLAAGPVGSTAAAHLIGLVEVAAVHLVIFGVARPRLPNRPALLVLLFALSWGIREVALGLVRSDATDPAFALAGGLTVGALTGLGSLLLMRWPGGPLTAPAAHWLALYLIAGYSD